MSSSTDGRREVGPDTMPLWPGSYSSTKIESYSVSKSLRFFTRFVISLSVALVALPSKV